MARRQQSLPHRITPLAAAEAAATRSGRGRPRPRRFATRGRSVATSMVWSQGKVHEFRRSHGSARTSTGRGVRRRCARARRGGAPGGGPRGTAAGPAGPGASIRAHRLRARHATPVCGGRHQPGHGRLLRRRPGRHLTRVSDLRPRAAGARSAALGRHVATSTAAVRAVDRDHAVGGDSPHGKRPAGGRADRQLPQGPERPRRAAHRAPDTAGRSRSVDPGPLAGTDRRANPRPIACVPGGVAPTRDPARRLRLGEQASGHRLALFHPPPHPVSHQPRGAPDHQARDRAPRAALVARKHAARGRALRGRGEPRQRRGGPRLGLPVVHLARDRPPVRRPARDLGQGERRRLFDRGREADRAGAVRGVGVRPPGRRGGRGRAGPRRAGARRPVRPQHP